MLEKTKTGVQLNKVEFIQEMYNLMTACSTQQEVKDMLWDMRIFIKQASQKRMEEIENETVQRKTQKNG